MRLNTTSRSAFTLIELLVVIAIIAILASLLFAPGYHAKSKVTIALAKAQLGQMESAIDEYEDKLGFYPPDNPNDPALNPLYFELVGTTNNGNKFVTLDASGEISVTDVNSKFGRQGFANTGVKAHAGDQSGAPMSFLNHLGESQTGQIDSNLPSIKILVCSVRWPLNRNPAPIPGTSLNPWRYVSSHPTNNTGSYDLWVDLPIGNKIYRVNNWSKDPQIDP